MRPSGPRAGGFQLIITPERAEQILKLAAPGRPIRLGRVAEYAEAMRRGEWEKSHQPIAFDREGHLVDGQHRMRAIVAAGVPVEVYVMYDVDDRSLKVIDQGARRSAHDCLRLAGLDERWDKNVVAVLRCFEFLPASLGPSWSPPGTIYTGRRGSPLKLRSRSQSITELENAARNWHAGILFAREVLILQHRQIPGYTRAVGALIARAFYHVKEKELRHFCRVLVEGLGTEERDRAVIAYRNFLARRRGEHSRGGPLGQDIYKKGQGALKAFLTGKPPFRIQMIADDLYPVQYGIDITN